MKKMISEVSLARLMWWTVCPFCYDKDCADCTVCLGTDLDLIPWAELFKDARKDHGRCGGPGRVRP